MSETDTKKFWYVSVIDFFKNIILTIFAIVTYALIGVKAVTYDLFVYLYNTITWRLGKGYKRLKEPSNAIMEEVKKKENKGNKTYKYSAKTLAKLEADYRELLRDLQTTGATRSKEMNAYYFKVRNDSGKIIKGAMNGLSKLDINAFLVNEGYTVYSIKTSPLINFLFKDSALTSPKMSTKELVFWLTQLATYLKADYFK